MSADLDRQFGIPGIATVLEGNGGMPRVHISSPQAAGDIYLHGAQVTSWRPAGAEEVLFVSTESRWKDGQAIRGGVPICFPWFGGKADNPKAPAHGFVRAKAWRLESVVQDGSAVIVTMFTGSDESTKQWWPADFRLIYRASFDKALTLDLVLTNTGPTPLRFEEALHTYFRVGDIQKAQVRGLDAVHYLDKTDSNRKKLQLGEVVIGSETDSVYLDTQHEIEVEDARLQRRIGITKQNSRTTVVWNPWAQKAQVMADFADDEWRQMICIEASNVGAFGVDLAPGQQHTLKTVVTVKGL